MPPAASPRRKKFAGPSRAGSQAGFTLIEAIVALVVLSAGVIGFYGFLSSAINSARRAEQALISVDRRQNALELANAINPMQTPDGVFDLGPYRIRWSSAIIDGPRQSTRGLNGAGIFKVALYRLTLSFPDDRQMAPITLTQMGYRRDRLVGQSAAGGAN